MEQEAVGRGGALAWRGKVGHVGLPDVTREVLGQQRRGKGCEGGWGRQARSGSWRKQRQSRTAAAALHEALRCSEPAQPLGQQPALPLPSSAVAAPLI